MFKEWAYMNGVKIKWETRLTLKSGRDDGVIAHSFVFEWGCAITEVWCDSTERSADVVCNSPRKWRNVGP